MRVLVIDDDAPLRKAIRRMLESAGHEVVEAADGRAGLEAFRAHAPDTVVTDIFMPQQEGIGTIRGIRALSPQVHIVAISGGDRTGNADVLRMAKLLGATATLAKPFQRQELIACVEGREPPAEGG